MSQDQTEGATGRSPPRASLALGNAFPFVVDGGVQAAGHARAEFADRLAARLDPEVVEVARLLLSELVTNCVRHGAAGRPEVSIHITVSLLPNLLWVEVSDGGPTFDHQPNQTLAKTGGGQGLYLVDQLSARWGISGRKRARVWFELRRAA